MEKGIRNVAALKGGYDDWRDAGLPTEPSMDAPTGAPTDSPTPPR